MRKMIVSFVLLLSLAAVVGAETVMVYVGNTAESEDIFNLCLPISSALEDGVMNEFFDEGHIIFNAGIRFKPETAMEQEFPRPPFDADRLPIRIAKAGGASYLLEIQIHYILHKGEEEAYELPEDFSADYVFSHITSSRVLQTGDMEYSAMNTGGDGKIEEYSYALGQAIAKEALSIW